ncbi:GAF domain-containing sensor histidine kinase [Anaeromyxobacter sp. Fw109-5]|uniref:GAF domain-containing sensor histidine kinase n=1 Tax=Anaeromyxobacter sp. (strain Fw109-5) TaxID=404589 RepID=UPI00030526A4|nr:GAF domain-containing sensor histidine kinase [Anaeromyxobacter sp. Fw109-5]
MPPEPRSTSAPRADPIAAATEQLLAVGAADLDRAVDAVLREAGLHVRADRAAVFLFGTGESLALERSWSTPGMPPPATQLDAPWVRGEIEAGRVVALSSLDDLPSSAEAERRFAEANGIHAALFVPLSCAGHPVLGWAGFVSLSQERSWERELIADARRFGMLLAAALLRLRAERERDEQGRLQALALEVSAGFMELPAERVGEGVRRALRLAACALAAERASAWLLDEDGAGVRRVVSWPEDPADPDPRRMHQEKPWLDPVLLRHLREHRAYALAALEHLPPAATAERAQLRALGVGSLAAIPLRAGERALGWLAFSCRGPHAWPERTLSNALIVGDIVAAALARARDAERMRASELGALASRDLLQSTIDALSAHVAITDAAGTIVAVNAAWRRFADENGLALPRHALAASYLGECDAAAQNGCAEAAAVGAAIRALADARREDFRLEYACHGAQRPRWFQLRITRFEAGGATRLVFAHEEVTELKQSEERLHALTGQILHVQDAERRRIARELHDGVAQQVFALSLEIARARGRSEDEETSRSLDECEALCRTVLQDLRTVSHVLHPPMLDVTGLVPALDWFVRGFATRSGIDVTFTSEGVARLSPETELALFRVVQESLANVQRHSGSRFAQVGLTQADGEVVLVIRDQGRGIRLGPESLVGVGVGGMRERIRQLGGTLRIRGGDEGTEIRAVVPARLP